MTDNRTVEGLRALAEKATSGPLRLRRYQHGGGRLSDEATDSRLVADFYNEGDREFYAAASPDVILRLLDVVDAARNYSPRDDHDWRCELRTKEAGWMPGDSPVIRCECGYNELRAALDRLDETGKPE